MDQAFQYNIGRNLRRNGVPRDGYTFTGWKRADNQQAYGDGRWVTNLTTQPNGIPSPWSPNEFGQRGPIRYNPNPPAGKTTGGQRHLAGTATPATRPPSEGTAGRSAGTRSPAGPPARTRSGARYAPGASWTANGTLTLYAQWTPGEAGLTYDGNGATGGKTDPQNRVTDQKVNVRQNGFTRDGYTFVRLGHPSRLQGQGRQPGRQSGRCKGSSTLYACWAGVAQTLTYHGNGATGGNTAAQSGHTGDGADHKRQWFHPRRIHVRALGHRQGWFRHRATAKARTVSAGYDEACRQRPVRHLEGKPGNHPVPATTGRTPRAAHPDTTSSTGQDVTIAQRVHPPRLHVHQLGQGQAHESGLQPGGRYAHPPATTTLWLMEGRSGAP